MRETAKTLRRRPAAFAMLVNLPPELAEVCQSVLADAGYRVVAVGHVPAACERMPVLMPLVVVSDAGAQEIERDELRERAVDVGAQMVWFARGSDASFVRSAVKLAADSALTRIARGPASGG